jgi:hypothetical protein
MRLDRPKKAVMAPMSQMSSSSEAVRVQRGEVGVVDLVRLQADLHREVEHGALARRDVGLAVVGGHLVGHQRLLLVDAQDGAVRHHAVQALVGRLVVVTIISRSPLVSAVRSFGHHQRVVVGEEGAPLGRPVRQRQEHVGHEAGLLLHLQHLGLDVVGQ